MTSEHKFCFIRVSLMLCVISLQAAAEKDGTSSNGKKFRITGPAPIFGRKDFMIFNTPV